MQLVESGRDCRLGRTTHWVLPAIFCMAVLVFWASIFLFSDDPPTNPAGVFFIFVAPLPFVAFAVYYGLRWEELRIDKAKDVIAWTTGVIPFSRATHVWTLPLHRVRCVWLSEEWQRGGSDGANSEKWHVVSVIADTRNAANGEIVDTVHGKLHKWWYAGHPEGTFGLTREQSEDGEDMQRFAREVASFIGVPLYLRDEVFQAGFARRTQ